MLSRKMCTAIYFFHGLDVEIRPNWTLPGSAPTQPSCLSTQGGAVGICLLFSLVGQWALFTRFGSCAGVIGLLNAVQKLTGGSGGGGGGIGVGVGSTPKPLKDRVQEQYYCPTKVDKQLGWVVRDPRFRPNLNIQPIK